MTAQLVLDASVACKWFLTVGEDGIEEAEALLQAQLSGDLVLVAPALLPIEVANAAHCSRLSGSAVAEAVEYLERVHIELFEATFDRLHATITLARRHRMSVCDALYLQLAEELACPLVTADRRAFAEILDGPEIRLL